MHTACAARKQVLAPKTGRIVTKIGREKNVSQPKIRQTSRNFAPFLTARVCFRYATTAKLSDNIHAAAGRRAILTGGAAMLYSLGIAES